MAIEGDLKLSSRIIRFGQGRAALEVDETSATLVGNENHVQVYSGTGFVDPGSVAITAPVINLLSTPESIKVAGIMSFNPMAFVPGANTFIMNPPSRGIAGMSNMIAVYSSMLSSLSAAAGA